jgi:hypothetical protein
MFRDFSEFLNKFNSAENNTLNDYETLLTYINEESKTF